MNEIHQAFSLLSAIAAGALLVGCNTSGVGILPTMPEDGSPSPQLVVHDGTAVARVPVVNYNTQYDLAGHVYVYADVAVLKEGVTWKEPKCAEDKLVYTQPGRATGQPVDYFEECQDVVSIAVGQDTSVLPKSGAQAEVIELPLVQNVGCTKERSCAGWYFVKVETHVPGVEGTVVSRSQPEQFDLFDDTGVWK